MQETKILKAYIEFFFSFSQRKGVVSIQNDYRIYEQLCKISSIASLYPNGQPFAGKVRETADRIASQLYRVAVIGEFKRGKSSLVNALLGTDESLYEQIDDRHYHSRQKYELVLL